MIPRRPDLDDLDREIRDHIEAETHDNVARGMSEDEARTAAIRKFGNVARVKEDVRAVWIPNWLDQLRQDARDAVRYVRRNPAFSLAIVVTLALGIGLSTAIYSVVNAVLLAACLRAPGAHGVAQHARQGFVARHHELNRLRCLAVAGHVARAHDCLRQRRCDVGGRR
jgi:hypothetical protein